MTTVVTPHQMRQLEDDFLRTAQANDVLIRRAATAMVAYIADHWPQPGHLLVCAGPGNNGADALAMIPALVSLGWHVELLVWRRAHDSWVEQARRSGAVIYDQTSLKMVNPTVSIIIDGLLGIGVNRPIQTDLWDIIDMMNQRHASTTCISVDVPSGCNASTGATWGISVRADRTLSTGPIKSGLLHTPALLHAGTIIALDIGLPLHEITTHLLTQRTVQPLLPPRPLDSYKGTFGTLCVWAGSDAYPGAAVLATTAAARSGAGVVSIATTRANVPLVWRQPEITLTLLDDHPLTALSAEHFDAYVIGPGLGRSVETHALLTTFINKLHLRDRPCVLDADALTLLARHPTWYNLISPRRAVLTPHRGELTRLCGGTLPDQPPLELARECATQWQQTLVMKGSTTIIASPDGRAFIWPHPNPVLATAGSGDVLAGIIGAMLAQGAEPFNAASIGVYLQGTIAASIAQTHGVTGILAGDLVSTLPHAIHSLRTAIE
ncbi:MAG: NAD(P)H-hydrate dehydratase [Chloroflexi bacterium]|nr:NAD(P)H-hydrate dehydratase [Chloroflexota bacterium]